MADQSFTLFTQEGTEEETEEETGESAAEQTAATGQDDTGSEIEETETQDGLQAQRGWTASESEFNRDNEEVPAAPASSSSGSLAIAVILFIIGLLLLLYGFVF